MIMQYLSFILPSQDIYNMFYGQKPLHIEISLCYPCSCRLYSGLSDAKSSYDIHVMKTVPVCTYNILHVNLAAKV